jgi:hypothetical protein
MTNSSNMKKGVKRLMAKRKKHSNPNLTMHPDNSKPLGKFGRMRKAYLKEAKPAAYNEMLLSDTLMSHLHRIDSEAWAMLERLTAQLLEQQPYQPEMTDWERTQHRLALEHTAEETVITELIQGS